MIESVFSKLRHLYSAFSFFSHTKWNSRGKYIDPWKIIWVDPVDVKYCTVPGFDVRTHTGKTISGKWDVDEVVKAGDRMRYPFEELVFFQSLHNHFTHDVPWEDTALFTYFVGDSEYGEAASYDSAEDFLQRCEVIDEVYESIRNNGYQTQMTMLYSERSDPGGWGDAFYWNIPPLTYYRKLNEIAINIGRSGQFLFNNRGHHRLSIAKILGLDTIRL